MNILIALLFIPLSFAGGPTCQQLTNYLQHYEASLHRKTLKDCPNIDHSTIISGVKEVVDPNFLRDKVCQDFTSIETQLQNARLQLSVLNGIEKLKSTIQGSKEATEKAKPEVAQVPAKTFVASLDTAQSLEVLLDSRTKDKSFIQALKDIPDQPGHTPQMELSDRIALLCKGLPKDGVCNSNIFRPGDEAAAEIMGMIKNSAPSDKDIDGWKKKLAIKKKNSKDDSKYSFTMMKKDLNSAFAKLDSKEPLTKDEIKKIQMLDDFEDLQGPSIVGDLNLIKTQKQKRIASDKFLLLMGDAKLRQQYDIQSKVSIAWYETAQEVPEMSPEDKATCADAKSLISKASDCITLLESKLPKMNSGLSKSKLETLIPALKISLKYANDLEAAQAACQAEIKSNDVLSEACWGKISDESAQLKDHILQLNLLKARITFENKDTIKFRNYALEKFKDPTSKCGASSFSSMMDMCDSETVINKESFLTIANNLQIAVMSDSSIDLASAESDVKQLCDDEQREKSGVEKNLCSYLDTEEVKPEDAPKTYVSKPIPDSGFDADAIKRRDVMIQGAANILGTAMTALYPKPQFQMPVNPYPFNYNPYGAGSTPPLGIADGIMFNARYYGAYGYYAPTPGYQPGTAFGMNSYSAYKPMSASSSKYFSY